MEKKIKVVGMTRIQFEMIMAEIWKNRFNPEQISFLIEKYVKKNPRQFSLNHINKVKESDIKWDTIILGEKKGWKVPCIVNMKNVRNL